MTKQQLQAWSKALPKDWFAYEHWFHKKIRVILQKAGVKPRSVVTRDILRKAIQ
jgi:hypothetical protein